MKFKLNWGTHRVVKGRETIVYQAGATIYASSPLDELFPLKLNAEWKFTRLEDDFAPLRPEIPVVRSPSNPVEGVSEQTPSAVIEGTQTNTNTTVAQEVVLPDPIILPAKTELNEYGEDVTTEFPKSGDFQVRYDGVRYRVFNRLTGSMVSRKKKLISPKAVRIFLKKQLAGV